MHHVSGASTLLSRLLQLPAKWPIRTSTRLCNGQDHEQGAVRTLLWSGFLASRSLLHYATVYATRPARGRLSTSASDGC